MKIEIKVLVLDDDPFFEIFLRNIFFDSEYQIFKTLDCPSQLIKYLSVNRIDLVICNIFMKGNYLDKTLFVDINRRGIPVVCVTSVAEDLKYEELKDFIQGYLVKPFHKNTLLSILKNILELSSKSKLYDFMDEKYLFIRNKGRELEKINFSEIVYLESTGNYCSINSKSKRYVEKISLTKILNDKLDYRFRRVHHRFAINTEYLERIDKSEVKLTTTMIPLSNTFRHNLKNIIEKNLKL